MFKSNLAVAVKIKNSCLREKEPGIVYIPFGSEYSLYIKNKDTRDVKINVKIDGKDVLDNSSLIVKGLSHVELNGFLKGNTIKRRFKFVQKTKESLEATNRKDNYLDDGIIEVIYQYTKKIEEVKRVTYYNYFPHLDDYLNIPWKNIGGYFAPLNYGSNQNFSSSDIYYENINGKESYSINHENSKGENFSIKSENIPQNYFSSLTTKETIQQLSSPKVEEGITVKGSKVNEKLSEAWIGELEDQKETIIIQLRGIKTSDQELAETSIFVSFCPQCGKKVKNKDNFCKSCGFKLK